MNYYFRFTKAVCLFLTIICITCITTSNTYGLTKGQESVKNIGVQITWYDFGKEYKSYNIQGESKEGLYELSMYDSSNELKKIVYINKKGEAVPKPENYNGEDSSYTFYGIPQDDRIYIEKEVNGLKTSAYVDRNGNMLTGYKECKLHYLSDKLYMGQHSGSYPNGIAPPNDYLQRFALFDSNGNNLTGFKYENAGIFCNNFKVVYKYYDCSAGLINQYGAEVLPTIFDQILLTDEGYAFVTISDPETQRNSRVGYFKIPESFSNIKNAKPITVYFDGVELYFDCEPIIKNQRTMVPIRKIFEVLGATVDWDKDTRTVIAKTNDKNIKVTIESDVAVVNGSDIQLEVSPFIKDGTTLVPLRFISENLGADVKWDGAMCRVIITKNR